MQNSIERFALSLLSYKGALVEDSAGASNALLGAELAASLGMSEYERLVFDPARDVAGAIRVDYDSPSFEAMGRLVDSLGELAYVRVASPQLKLLDPGKEIERVLRLQNGVFRFQECVSATQTYFCFFIQYEVMADERSGGIVEVWVNPSTRSMPRLPLLLDSVEFQDDVPPPDLGGGAVQAWDLAVPAVATSIRSRLGDFTESLKRRRERDLRRILEYYQAIDGEIRRKMARAGSKQDVWNAEKQRLEATALAYRSRAAEVLERYRMRVRVTVAGVLACAIPTYRIRVQLLRRSAKRDAWFSWNPFDRQVESACCDACRQVVEAAALCDDRVHYLCLECFKPCPECSKPFCRACRPRCPRGH